MHDLSVGWDTGGAVEIVDVNLEMTIDVARDGCKNLVIGEYDADFGPRGGNGASRDDACARTDVAADGAAESEEAR